MPIENWTTGSIWVAIIVIVLVFLSRNISSVFKGEKAKPLYKYNKEKYLLTKAENEFYKQLVSLFGERYYIFPQIHLSSILDCKIVGQNWKKALNHINRKSVDYVFCDKTYISPLLAIEFDDITHSRNDRRDRDKEVERILEEANLPLLRIPYTERYNKEKILQSVNEILDKKVSTIS